MRQLDKLVKYPQFEKLWPRLLHLLSFSRGPQGFSPHRGAGENLGKGEAESLHRTVAVARDGPHSIAARAAQGRPLRAAGTRGPPQDMVASSRSSGGFVAGAQGGGDQHQPPSVKKENF